MPANETECCEGGEERVGKEDGVRDGCSCEPPEPSTTSDEKESTVASKVPSICEVKKRTRRLDVDVDDFVVLKVIGQGTFAQQVALAKHKETEKPFAIKSLDKLNLMRRKQVGNTIKEKRILETIGADSPFIVQLHYAFQTPDDVHMVLEFCPGGELFYHLQQAGKFSVEDTRFYGAEILCGLKYLHDKNVAYRDLKPENVLLDEQGHIRLADFGFARDNMRDGMLAYTFCGSPEYLSPEMIQRCGHTKSTDIWSFGCLVFELLEGEPPFADPNFAALYHKIKAGKVPFSPFLPAEAKGLIAACLTGDMYTRPTAAKIMDHEFFKGIDWRQVEKKKLCPPIRPTVFSPVDTSNFDIGFTSLEPDPISPMRKRGSSRGSAHPYMDSQFEDF